jgi:hypothetical protein
MVSGWSRVSCPGLLLQRQLGALDCTCVPHMPWFLKNAKCIITDPHCFELENKFLLSLWFEVSTLDINKALVLVDLIRLMFSVLAFYLAFNEFGPRLSSLLHDI